MVPELKKKLKILRQNTTTGNENRVDKLIDVSGSRWMDGAPNDASGE